MTQIFHQLRTDVTKSSELESQELREYALFVCEQIPNIKKSYQQNLQTKLCEWLEIVGSSIKTTLNSRKINQIGPKLELIYTTVINQQQTINRYIKQIADVILKENYCFINQNDCTFKKAGLKYTETSQSAKKEEVAFKNSEGNSFYNSKQKTILKGRSLSNGSQRRKLSKVSCFAEAKKIQNQNNNFVQTAPTTFLKPSAGKNIKKTKKKEESCFNYLQKCTSSTSASNFMLGYIAKAGHRKEQQDRSRINHRVDQNQNQSIVITDKSDHILRNEITVPPNGQGHSRNGSETYEKMMLSFEEKIGQKLDELMNKYSKIQQKLQSKELQHPNKQIKSQIQYQISVHTPSKNVKQSQSASHKIQVQEQNYDKISVQNKVAFVEKQMKKVTKQKQSDKEPTQTKVSTSNLNKSIISKNKIVRNRLQELVVQQESLESITLPKTSLKTLSLQQNKHNQPSMLALSNVQLLSSKIIGKKQQESVEKQLKKIQEDSKYICQQIIEFNKTSQKVILPISKKLLFIIKNKYQAFCRKHNSKMIDQIGNIHTEEVNNEVAELRDLLQKMQKILQLKCNEQKKQKLILYVCSFLRCYLSFGDQTTVIRLARDQINEQTASNRIKESLNRLR